jgi:hypothetical protein
VPPEPEAGLGLVSEEGAVVISPACQPTPSWRRSGA